MEPGNVPQIVEYARVSLNLTPFATRWIPNSSRFVMLGMNPRGTGALHIYSLDEGKLPLMSSVREVLFSCAEGSVLIRSVFETD